MDRAVKITVVVSVFFLLLLAYVGVQYVLIYDALYKVNIEIDNVVVDELSETKATLSVTMNLFNPGFVDVRIIRLQWQIYLNDRLIGSNDMHPNELIAPSETYVRNTKLDITYPPTLQTLLQAQEKNEGKWRILGSARFETPLLKMETPFDKENIFFRTGS